MRRAQRMQRMPKCMVIGSQIFSYSKTAFDGIMSFVNLQTLAKSIKLNANIRIFFSYHYLVIQQIGKIIINDAD